MAQNISTDQSELSQYIQLLYRVHSSNAQMPCLDVPELGSRGNGETKKIIRILDTIAVALTTGKPGEVLAVGLDKTSGFKLILAKNGPHTIEDDQAVCRLLDVLKKPDTSVVENHILPFLLSHCKENINKRVNKMIEALGALEEDLEEYLETYTVTPLSPGEQFPDSRFYFAMKKPGKTPEFVDTMGNLWSDISKEGQAFLDLTKCHGSVEDEVKSFIKLAMLAIILEKSPFLKWLCDPVHPLQILTQKPCAERLKRRLGKVCQYYQGIHKLVKYTKRIPADSISYLWVSPITGTGNTAVHLDDYLSVVSQILHLRSLPDDAAVRIRNRFPELEKNWPSNRSIVTCVHVEIRVLLHLDSSSNPPDHEPARNWQPIGCSKRTCLCCTLWIDAYNESARTRWLTGSSGGKSYAAWALPGHGSAAVARRMADDAVKRGVKSRLDDFLDLLFPDEDSGSEDDAIWRELTEQSLEL